MPRGRCQLEGVIKMKEVAAGASLEIQVMNETLFRWDSQHDASFPSKVNFQCTLPLFYLDPNTGVKFRLPPSYKSPSSAIPGFQVEICYAVTVQTIRVRNRLDWWRKESK